MIRFCYTCGGPLDELDRREIIVALAKTEQWDLALRLTADWWDDTPKTLALILEKAPGWARE